MKVTNNVDFNIYVQEHYIINKEDDTVPKEDLELGYLSKELPHDWMHKVLDEWFDQNLMDGTAVVPLVGNSVRNSAEFR